MNREELMLLGEILQKKIDEFGYTPRDYREWEKQAELKRKRLKKAV